MPFWNCITSRLKYPAIRAGLELTALPPVRGLFPGAGGRGVIWTLHHVRPDAGKAYAPNAYLDATPTFLAEAIEESLAAGLVPVHVHDLPALLADPHDKRRFVAFTLDDGYRDNYEFAAPQFRKYGVPYTIYVTPGFVERTRTPWWETAEALTAQCDQLLFDFGAGARILRCASRAEKDRAFDRFAAFIRAFPEDEAVARLNDAALANGIDPIALVDALVMTPDELARFSRSEPLVHFGAHTMTHSNLCRLDHARLKYEVDASIAAVESYTGERPKSFSYPYGWANAFCPVAEAMVAAAGLRAGVTTRPGVLCADVLTHTTSLPRVSLNGYYQRRRYVRALLSGIPFMLLR